MAIIDKPDLYFNTKLYTGNNNTTQTISGVGFQPDLVWIKNRDNVEIHYLFDAVRGSGKILSSSYSNAEADLPVNTKPTIASDGFTLTSNGSNDELNFGTRTYVSWNWLAGTSFTNDASATGIGSIDSTGSVNTDAGFSIISYTGNASASQSVAHGLGVAPKIVLVKPRNQAYQWLFQTTQIDGSYDYLYLDQTNAKADLSVSAPTSTVFNLSNSDAFNGSGDSLIAYCFADTSMSKMGSYTGNGSTDGTFVYTGFKPAFVIIKKTNSTGDWTMYDNKRIGYNGGVYRLKPNTDEAENTSNVMDLLSNGFKLKVSDGDKNGSGDTFIYMAFAENPFVTSTGVPATAR